MERADIFAVVSSAIRKAAQARPNVTFKWSLVPAKSLTSGGLGLGFNAYHLFLDDLLKNKLPQKRPFTALSVGPLLLRDTHSKALSSLRSALMQRIDATIETGFKPLTKPAQRRRPG